MRSGYIIILFVTALSGCYSLNKAKQQLGRAVSTYPEIGAGFCADTCQVKTDTILKGGTIVHLDTLYMGDEITFDTLTVMDTLRIEKTVTKPVYINKIIQRVDTIIKENTAALRECQIYKDKAISLLEVMTKKYDKWRAIAKNRWWIIAGMGAVMFIGIVLFIRRKLKGKI